ncbi:Acetyltransferase (GNAT) domain-containing protein [Arthrobacter sp. ov407]|uniref:GNAT family N-acetyltransferase n=1 Tax=Arthrobacter sp. ov407 TaxID=1761748 RepID=UPI00088A56CE|nr:GNAT family N-acetyltransferase [Arthrobacter sp. ov407]SDL29476.1 Acetyltransferase (GNAT) domain-containing protein [Arthrobacter sp. ov407]
MLIIREGLPRDVPGLATLRAIWAAEQEPALKDDPAFDAVFREWMDASPRQFFVAEDGGELIGMLNLMIFERMPKPGKESSRWVYLGNVYVLPEFRNAGIGGRLVDASIQFSQSIKAVRMVLSPSAESRDFYARLGFEPAGELNILRF